MNGLYLYCLRERSKDAPALCTTRGIDGQQEVFGLPYRRLEAIVSRVSLKEYGSEEIQKKASEDLNWIKEKAIIHESVIEEAMGKGSQSFGLIPMRFGTVFNENTKIEETFASDYLKFEQVIDRIRGKQEWSVKVYLKDKGILEQRVRANHQALKEKEEAMAALPEGIAFFMEEEVTQLVAEAVDLALSMEMDRLFNQLTCLCSDSVKTKVLTRELTGRGEPMVFNSAYLMHEDCVEAFKKDAEILNQDLQTKGLCLECSGPWPAYHFIGD